MDRPTINVYEQHAGKYAADRGVQQPDRARAFARSVAPPGIRLDLGCGPGHYVPLLGSPVVAADAAGAMLDLVPTYASHAWRVRCDQEALPFRSGSIEGIWASKSLQHVAPDRLPRALAGLHRVMTVGGRLAITLFAGVGEMISDDDLPGRYFALWHPDELIDVLVGAGFDLHHVEITETKSPDIEGRIAIDAVRQRTLADSVGPGMRLLMCGLNPSLFAADAGVGFARPGNRFWPAMVAAGLAIEKCDQWALLDQSAIGMTDIVKRATVAASELTPDEYRDGLGRMERLCRRLSPGAVCMVGLAGWRAAVDQRATAGWQPVRLGGRPVYVMPSTSGLNARSRLHDLVRHLRAAAAGQS